LDNTTQSDVLFGSGVFVGTMNPGRVAIIRFRAQVENASVFSSNITNVINTVTATASNAGTVSDTAVVQVIRPNQVVVPGVVSIQKFGRNITRGQSAELTSVSIRANDTVEFIIRIRSLSSTTMTNVIVTDSLPAGLNYIPNTTSVNNLVVSDGLTGGGINIGSLAPNQEALVRFSARVDNISRFPSGSLTGVNTAFVRADNTPTASAQMTLNFGVILTQVGTVKTGAGSSVLMALMVSGLLTFGYMRYTRTNMFLRRDAGAALRRSLNDPQRLNFARFL
jgi:uncharacterized repeat protein (TIGR01451 family)